MNPLPPVISIFSNTYPFPLGLRNVCFDTFKLCFLKNFMPFHDVCHVSHQGLVMLVIILIAIVTRKSVEKASATFLSLFWLMIRFIFPWYGEMSSDVTSRIMAVMASHRLMSQNDRGKSVCYSSKISKLASITLPSS